MKPIIKDPKKRAKAKKALRVVAAISTSGGSEVARAKMKIAQKAAGAVVDKMQKKNGGIVFFFECSFPMFVPSLSW